MQQYRYARTPLIVQLMAAGTVLAACGGGGGGTSDTSANSSAALIPSGASAVATSAQASSAPASEAASASPVATAASSGATESSAIANILAIKTPTTATGGSNAGSNTGSQNTTGSTGINTKIGSASENTPPVLTSQPQPSTALQDSSSATSITASSNKPNSSSSGTAPNNCTVYAVHNFGNACYANAIGTIADGSSLSFANQRSGYLGIATANCNGGKVRWDAEVCNKLSTSTSTSAAAANQVAPSLAGNPTTAAITSESASARVRAAAADMALGHEVIPAGVGTSVGWKYKPTVAMGTEPYGSSIGSWWPGTLFPEWRSMVTWFVIYPDESGNPAKNTAVEISGIELWSLSIKDKAWKLVQSSLTPTWSDIVAQDAINASNTKAFQASTSTSAIYAPGPDNMMHGGLGHAVTPWNLSSGRADINALLVVIRHRLVLKDPKLADDRASARLGLQAGVDYYPFVGAKVSDLNASYVPGAGVGRFIKVTPNWRYSTTFIRSSRISEQELLAIPAPNLLY